VRRARRRRNNASRRPRPPSVAAGSKKRLMEAINRRSAWRSTWSARPKLWITLATSEPVSACRFVVGELEVGDDRSVLVLAALSRRYTPTRLQEQAGQLQYSCAYTFGLAGAITPGQRLAGVPKCLRTSEVRSDAKSPPLLRHATVQQRVPHRLPHTCGARPLDAGTVSVDVRL